MHVLEMPKELELLTFELYGQENKTSPKKKLDQPISWLSLMEFRMWFKKVVSKTGKSRPMMEKKNKHLTISLTSHITLFTLVDSVTGGRYWICIERGVKPSFGNICLMKGLWIE